MGFTPVVCRNFYCSFPSTLDAFVPQNKPTTQILKSCSEFCSKKSTHVLANRVNQTWGEDKQPEEKSRGFVVQNTDFHAPHFFLAV